MLLCTNSGIIFTKEKFIIIQKKKLLLFEFWIRVDKDFRFLNTINILSLKPKTREPLLC